MRKKIVLVFELKVMLNGAWKKSLQRQSILHYINFPPVIGCEVRPIPEAEAGQSGTRPGM